MKVFLKLALAPSLAQQHAHIYERLPAIALLAFNGSAEGICRAPVPLLLGEHGRLRGTRPVQPPLRHMLPVRVPLLQRGLHLQALQVMNLCAMVAINSPRE